MPSELEALKARVAELEKAAHPNAKAFVVTPQQRANPLDTVGGIPTSAMAELTRAVGTDLMQDIVRDNRRSPFASAGPTPKAEPPARGSGWQEPRPFPDRTKEFELIDRIVESKIGGPNTTR